MLTLLPTKTKAGFLNPEFLRELKERLSLATFVETGTFQGDGAAAASAMFPVVHTIELSEALAEKARERFAGTPAVNVHQGDSAIVLGRVLGELSEPTLFWLGRHHSEGATTSGEKKTPIQEEIATITRGAPEGSVILVDDLRLFNGSTDQPNVPSLTHSYPPLTEIYALFAQSGYQFFVLGDVGLAVSASAEFTVSPLIQALTISRLYDGENLDVNEVFAAETVIMQADGHEREILRAMSAACSATESSGIGLHERFWTALNLLGAGQFAAAGQELAAVVQRGFNHWRLRWYFAQFLCGLGDKAAARPLLKDLLARAPEFEPAQQLLRDLNDRSAGDPIGDSSARDCGDDCSSVIGVRLKPGDLVFDIGANVGAKTEKFLQLGARVVCVEPQPECVKTLRRKFASDERVIVVAAGLAAEPGEMVLSICSRANTISTFSERWKEGRFADHQWDKKITVPVTTLDALIEAHGVPTYCKIDVEGFELEVLRGLSTRVSNLSFEFTIEFLSDAERCAARLEEIGFRSFNVALGESTKLVLPRGVSAAELFDRLRSMGDPTLWGDIYAETANVAQHLGSSHELLSGAHSAVQVASNQRQPLAPDEKILSELASAGLWQPGKPLRLHLGCGEQRLKGYVNIDYPAEQHNVMHVRPDYEANITQMQFPPQSVDEIRLHHVFEHFNRVTALAMLIKWQQWLKVGGKLHLETPDLLGSAETLVSDASWKIKMGTVRHLAGDQAASWAYHVDHWFPERYQRTLEALGFGQVETKSTRWPHEPHLCNVHAFGVKTEIKTQEELMAAADDLLRESTIAASEKPTWEVWKRQLRAVLAHQESCGPANIHTESPPPLAVTAQPERVPARPPKARSAAETVPAGMTSLGQNSDLPLDEILDFNQRSRDRWVKAKAATVPAGARVLDIGAGTCLYRPLFAHCDYKTHDFKQYTGSEKHGGKSAYGHIDYVSEILAIPVPDHSFDVILCTEVLEHVPEPIKVLREISRILKPGGRAFITAPLASGLHQLPFHFYGGYTPEWYKRFSQEAGLDAIEITPNGGFFKHLAQECGRAAFLYAKKKELHGLDAADLFKLLREGLPRFFFALDEKIHDDRFTVGYFVEVTKIGSERGDTEASIARQPKSAAGRMTPVLGDTRAPADLTRNQAPARPVVVAKLMGGMGNQMFQYAAGLALARRTGAKLELDLSFLQDRTPKKNFTYRDFDLDLFNLPADCAIAQTPAPTGRQLTVFKEKQFHFDGRFESLDANTQLEGHWQSLRYFHSVSEEVRRTFTSFRVSLTAEQEALASKIRSHVSVCLNVRRGDYVSNAQTNAFHGVCSTEYFRQAVRHILRRAPDAHFYIFSDDLDWCRNVDLTDGAACTFVSNDYAGERFSAKFRLMMACRHFIIPNSSFGWWAAFLGQKPESIVIAPTPWFSDLSIEMADVTPPEWTLLSRAPGPFAANQPAKPCVSVIVPCYKQAHYLQECVESVVGQTFADWEVIIVNDGSPDDTSRVAREIIERHPQRRIRLVEKPNGGLADARNAGIREACGKYILPLDSDDRLHPEMLAKTVGTLEADPKVAIAYTDLVHFGAVSKVVRAGEYDFRRLPQQNQLNACSLFRRDAWVAVGGYNRNMTWGYEDWDFWVGCGEKGFFGRHVPEALLYYRVKDSSMYTKALEHHRELHAQIVLNHPKLFSEPQRIEAKRVLEQVKPAIEKQAEQGAPSLVSVVIPCYQQAQYLAEAVESVTAQTYSHWEIVIVNDGSPDGTSRVAQQLIFKHAGRKIRLIEKENGGLADARNAGVLAARGRYVLPLDADDKIAPQFLAKTVALLDANSDVGIAYTDWVYFGGANLRRDAIDYDFSRLCGKENLFTCTSLYRREAWNAVGGYNSNMTRGLEDWDFWIGCGEKGFFGRRIPEPLFFYRAKNGSMIHTLQPHLQTMFARIILNHPRLYSTTVVEKARETFESADLPPPKPSSPGIEWLPSPEGPQQFAELVTSAERLLKEGRAAAATELIEQALSVAPTATCADRAREILEMLQSSNESGANPQATAPAAEHDFFAGDELANIERMVAAYAENPSDPATRDELHALQQGLMKYLVTTPRAEIERRWTGNFAQVFRVLAKSGFVSEPATEESTGQLAVLDEAISESKRAKGGFDFRPLLARMLCAPAHRGAIKFAPEKVPSWLVDDYLAYLLHAPDVFVVPGEADEYHVHMLGCLRSIAQRIRIAPNDPVTRKAASVLVKTKAIPLYFADADTREAAEKRAGIVEYVLGQKGASIDHAFPKRSSGHRKIRVGFLNAHFGPQTETHVTLPMLQVDRDKFEVSLFAVAKNAGAVEDYCRSFAHSFTILPTTLEQRVKTIREAELDVLVVGTNLTAVTNEVVLIASHRLAPVQLASYCSPVSTGMRHIDGYITGTLNDGPGIRAQFSETLRFCDGPPGCLDYTVEKVATSRFDRASLGIRDDEIVFVNAGACYKILPEMQDGWARILKAVPNSRLLLLPFNPNWSRSFPAKQFERTLTAACCYHGVDHRRLILAGSLPSRADVKALEAIADIYLDTYPFSGSISVIDPLELGIPTVVREGNTHRGRMASALLRELGITDLIVRDETDYIALATHLATDATLRRGLRERILSAMALKPKFINPSAYAQDFGVLLESLVTGAQSPAEAVA